MIKRILLDPGHGGRDLGAKSGTVLEKDLVLRLAHSLRGLLQNKGFDVLMTRDSDTDFSLDHKVDLQSRVDIVKQAGADILLSIHCNAHTNAVPRGWEIYAFKEGDRLLADRIGGFAGQEKVQPIPYRGIRVKNFYVLANVGIPAVLLELGFITNTEDLKVLVDPTNDSKVLKPIVDSLSGGSFYLSPVKARKMMFFTFLIILGVFSMASTLLFFGA